MGALRAIEEMRLMNRVDLIVSVSGGGWTAGPYMFSHRDWKSLLGHPTVPSMLNMRELSKTPDAAIGESATKDIGGLLKENFFSDNPHEVWVNIWNEILLEPLGLGNTSKYMAPDHYTVKRIVRENPHLKESDFIFPKANRPRAFVMCGVLLAPLGHEASDDTVVSFQMSPDFSGSPFYPGEGRLRFSETRTHMLGASSSVPKLKAVIGGGMVETWAFGADTPGNGQDGGEKVKMTSPSEPLSLAKAIGISSAAFAGLVVQMGKYLGGMSLQSIIPVGTIWPITSKEHPSPQVGMKYRIGDGGHLDNSGLIPTLQRGVRNIALFVDTDASINMKTDYCSSQKFNMGELSDSVVNYVLDKFGIAKHETGYFLLHNQVFAFRDLQPILCDLQTARRAGRAAVSVRKLKVLKNSWWGIKGGWYVKLLIYYMDKAKLFDERLPADTQKEIAKGKNGALANFPGFLMMSQNPNTLTSYTNPQVNLLAAFVEWGVRENEAKFRDILTGRHTGREQHGVARGGKEHLHETAGSAETTDTLVWEKRR